MLCNYDYLVYIYILYIIHIYIVLAILNIRAKYYEIYLMYIKTKCIYLY